MARKNRYLFRAGTFGRKVRDLLRLFARDITADRATELTGLRHNATPALYRRLRLRMTELAREGCPFRGQVEIDESTFGPARVRGRRGRGGARKTSVFGILKCDGRVHCQIVINCLKVS